jgi:hypothetical protein
MGTTGRLAFMDAQETTNPIVARMSPKTVTLPRTFNINRDMAPLPLSKSWIGIKHEFRTGIKIEMKLRSGGKML